MHNISDRVIIIIIVKLRMNKHLHTYTSTHVDHTRHRVVQKHTNQHRKKKKH